MPITISDESTVIALSVLNGPEELRSADGRLLGRFIPNPAAKMTYPEFGMTDEELNSRSKNPNAIWYTAEEVSERLRQLRKAQ